MAFYDFEIKRRYNNCLFVSCVDSLWYNIFLSIWKFRVLS